MPLEVSDMPFQGWPRQDLYLYYPADDETWTEDALEYLGRTSVWTPYTVQNGQQVPDIANSVTKTGTFLYRDMA